jgi:Flp pilus assembly pilin Flp
MCSEAPGDTGRPLAVLLGGAAVGRTHERGGSLVEYSLLIALIAVVTIGALVAFGTARDAMWERSASSIIGP